MAAGAMAQLSRAILLLQELNFSYQDSPGGSQLYELDIQGIEHPLLTVSGTRLTNGAYTNMRAKDLYT